MSLTQDQIIRLQKLTALKQTQNIDIASVVDFFGLLNVAHIPTGTNTTRSGQGTLIPRQDTNIDSGISDELLACSNQKKAAHQIVLGGIMHGE